MPSPNRHIRITRFCLLLGALVALFLVFTLVEHARGKTSFDAWIKERERAGEPIHARELLPPTPPPESNAAPALLALLKDHPLREFRDASPPAQRYLDSNHVAVVTSLISWSDYETNEHDWPALQRIWLAESSPVEAAVEILLSKPAFHLELNYDNGFFDWAAPPLTTAQNLSRALEIASLLALQQQRTADSLRYLRALIRLSTFQSQQTLVLQNIVGYALTQIAFRTTWQAIATGQLTAGQLRELAQAWEGFACLPHLVRAFQIERAMTVRQWEMMREDPARLLEMLGQLSNLGDWLPSPTVPDPENALIGAVYLPYWKVAWFDQDKVRALKT